MLAFPGLPIQQLRRLLLLLEGNQLESGLSGTGATPEEYPGGNVLCGQGFWLGQVYTGRLWLWPGIVTLGTVTQFICTKPRKRDNFLLYSHLAVTSTFESRLLNLILLLIPAPPAAQVSAHQQAEKGDSEVER